MKLKIVTALVAFGLTSAVASAGVVSVQPDGKVESGGHSTYLIVCSNGNNHRVFQKGKTWYLVSVTPLEINSTSSTVQEIAAIKCR